MDGAPGNRSSGTQDLIPITMMSFDPSPLCAHYNCDSAEGQQFTFAISVIPLRSDVILGSVRFVLGTPIPYLMRNVTRHLRQLARIYWLACAVFWSLRALIFFRT